MSAPSALMLAGSAVSADAQQVGQSLPVVRPIVECGTLLGAKQAVGGLGQITLTSAAVIGTPRGRYCKVAGTIGPGTIGFTVYLPVDRWTQRYVQAAQNVLPIPRGGANPPALRGELAVAITDKGGPGISRDSLWTSENQQKRIDWAYRANHMVALAAKALIRAYYGQPHHYAYFIGCSMGGREVLADVQRFPADFDGAVAGAPVVVDSLHNAFFPGWEWQANRRADGSIILSADRLPLLHDAALAHCAQRSGKIDGMLQHPGACGFDPAWVACKIGETTRAGCLSPEEAEVARKLYAGPTDPQGFLLDAGGFPLGSELTWRLSTAAGPANPASDPGNALVRLLSPRSPSQDGAYMRRSFTFSREWFDRAVKMAPLWDTANTDLRPFERRGGKLILWIGAADTVVQPASAVAYFNALQATVGDRNGASFARFFLLPGVDHCGGGAGPDQMDVLSAIMAWTEQGRAPAMLVAGKPDAATGRRAMADAPYAEPAAATRFTRPIFPYPLVARYRGSGDRDDVASYDAVRPNGILSQPFPAHIAHLFGPHNQAFYRMRHGVLEKKEHP